MRTMGEKQIGHKVLADLSYAESHYPWKPWIAERWFLNCRSLNWNVPPGRVKTAINDMIAIGLVRRRIEGRPADNFEVIELLL